MSRGVPGRCRHSGHVGRGCGALALALWLAAGGTAAAAELPRVFFTPAERAALRAERLAGRPMAHTNEPAAVPPTSTSTTAGGATTPAAGTSPPAARPLRVDGVTLGRGAAKSVWISGERVADGGRWRGYRVQVTRDGARLIAADGSVRHLRVGVEVPQ